jgi:hypothetical protein
MRRYTRKRTNGTRYNLNKFANEVRIVFDNIYETNNNN